MICVVGFSRNILNHPKCLHPGWCLLCQYLLIPNYPDRLPVRINSTKKRVIEHFVISDNLLKLPLIHDSKRTKAVIKGGIFSFQSPCSESDDITWNAEACPSWNNSWGGMSEPAGVPTGRWVWFLYLFFFVGCVGGHNNWSRRSRFPIKFLKAQVETQIKMKEFVQVISPEGKAVQD